MGSHEPYTWLHFSTGCVTNARSDIDGMISFPCSLSPDVSIQRHCVLVANLPSSSYSCIESIKYYGKNYEQLAKLMMEVRIWMLSTIYNPKQREP